MKFKSKLFYIASFILFFLGFYLRNAVVEAAGVQYEFSVSEFITKKESLELDRIERKRYLSHHWDWLYGSMYWFHHLCENPRKE